MNLYEHPNALGKSNMQNNFIFVDQHFENPSLPSTSLTGDSEILDNHTFQTSADNCGVNTIVNNVSDISKWSVVNDPNTGQFTIFTDNGIGNNNQGIRLENPNINQQQINYNQQFTKYNIPQQEMVQPDMNNYNYAPNLILAFPPTTGEENVNIVNNVMTIPQTPQNSFDFISPMNGTGQWINPVPRFQQIDPRSYFVRQVDRNERMNRMQQFDNGDQKYTKPVFSYSCLIALALKNSHSGSLPVNEIYRYMQENFPYFKTAPDGWKNSVRHNLSLNKAFQKNVRSDSMTTQRKGCLWTLKPDKRKSIDKEIKKWFKKHPDAIRKSMTNPDNFINYFNAEIEDSADDNSRSNSREDILVEKTNSMDVPATHANETQSSSLEHLPFFTNGLMNGSLEPAIPACDQFDSQFNSFFGEFCPPSWNTFQSQNNNAGRNQKNRLVKNTQLNFDIFEDKNPLL